MVGHTPPLKKTKNQGELPLPILSPIPSAMNGMRLGIGNSISLPFLFGPL